MEQQLSLVDNDIRMWWSHEDQRWQRKRLRLDQVPEKYRCPACGKILIKTGDRRPRTMIDERDREIKREKIKDLLALERPTKAEWDSFCERHKELFESKRIPLPDLPIIELGFYGGVCEECWLDGLGDYGKTGRIFKFFIERDDI